MMTALVTLAVGVAVGYLAQRSRLCFVGGVRDFLLVRDTALLKGALAFFLVAWLAFPVAALLGGSVWELPPAGLSGPAEASVAALAPAVAAATPFRLWLPAVIALTAGAGLGLASTLANGCPLRQHVLAGQGDRESWFYLGGFYGGAVVYHTLLQPWLATITRPGT